MSLTRETRLLVLEMDRPGVVLLNRELTNEWAFLPEPPRSSYSLSLSLALVLDIDMWACMCSFLSLLMQFQDQEETH